MANCEWQAIERDHNRHVEIARYDPSFHMDVIKVTNMSTEREQKVISCRVFCPVCNAYIRALMWRKSSPLNRILKVPIIDKIPETPTPPQS